MYKTTSKNIQRRRDRGKTKRSKTTAATGLYRVRPVDKLAAQVLGRPRKLTPKPNLAKLRKKAALTSDPELRDAILKQLAVAETRSEAAKKAVRTRLTGEKAVERAKRALDRAKWYRESS